MVIDFYNNIKSELHALGFEVTDQDLNRPWGAFFYIKESQAQAFSDHFFGIRTVFSFFSSFLL